MDCISQAFPIIIYFLLIILIIAAIAVLLKSFGTLQKIDKLVDSATDKVNSLQGFFNILDSASDTFAVVGDKVVGLIVNGISKLFSRKKEEDENE